MLYKVNWQYSSSGVLLGPQLAQTAIHCSVIATESSGFWVGMFIEMIGGVNLGGANADECRAVLADGTEFILSKTLCPVAQVTQSVPFLTSSLLETQNVVISTDGKIRFKAMGVLYSGQTEMLGSIGLTWFVPF